MSLSQRKSLAQEVADLIEKEIRSGGFAVDQKLPTEPEFMQKFAVGRSTIREAIKYLVQRGFVNVVQGVGTFVASRTGNEGIEDSLLRADRSELSEVRNLLEFAIAENAAIRRSNEDMDKIYEALRLRGEYAQGGLVAKCFHADVQFHLAVAESCGNRFLFELYKILSLKVTKSYFDNYSDTSLFVKTHPLHEELVKWIGAKNPRKASEAVNKIAGIM